MTDRAARLRVLLVALLVALAAPTGSAQSVETKLDEYLTGLANQGFSGAVLAARDGKVLFRKGYGLANAEWGIANAPDTRFRIGSITKQFTAASILLLQERGKLRVGDPICQYVTACPPSWQPITIHHLLTHTSGIPSYTNVKTPDEFRVLQLNPVTVAGFVDTFKARPLEFAPGERMAYNNSGYFLLGHIVEQVSGQSYEAFLLENIVKPLGLDGTGYDSHGKVIRNRATGYSFRAGERVNSGYLDMTVPYAAGALYSTVDDLFTWTEALFGDKLLRPESRTAMTTVEKNNYAYGLVVSRRDGRAVVSHNGGINGFNTVLARLPDERVTVIVLRNADYGTTRPEAIEQAMTAIVLGAPQPATAAPQPSTAAR